MCRRSAARPSTEYTPTRARRCDRRSRASRGRPTASTRSAPGRRPAFRLRPPFRRAWTFHGRALLEFPPAVGYGRVYITNFAGASRARRRDRQGRLALRSGTLRLGVAGARRSPRVRDVHRQRANAARTQRDGEIAAFDARTGRVRWRRSIGPTESSPLVARGTVYVGDWNGACGRSTRATGRTRWTTPPRTARSKARSRAADAGSSSAPTAATSSRSTARTGRVLWRSGGHGSLYSSPAVAYGRVYIGSLDGGVYAFGASDRPSSLGACRPAATCTPRPRSGAIASSSARTTTASTPSMPAPATCAGAFDAKRAHLRRGERDRRPRLLLDVQRSARTRSQAANGRRVRTWPDGKYSPAVADGRVSTSSASVRCGARAALGGFGGMVLVARVRWASRCKDAGSLASRC